MSSAANSAVMARAVETCVPFSSARPSLGLSWRGVKPAPARALAAESVSPATRTSPSPINANVMWASGARSPEAPTEPLDGMQGTMLALSIRNMASITSTRTPENPRPRLAALSSRTRRTAAASSSDPTPAPVRTNDPNLQFGKIRRRDFRGCERAESRIDAVRDVAPRDRVSNDLGRRLDRPLPAFGKADGARFASNLAQVAERQIAGGRGQRISHLQPPKFPTWAS